MDKPVRIEFELVVAVRYDLDEGCYYASSPNIDIVRDGKTQKEALKMFREALEILVIGSYGKGTLEKVFSQYGYKCKRYFAQNQEEVLRFEREKPDQTLPKAYLTEQNALHIQQFHKNVDRSEKQLCRV